LDFVDVPTSSKMEEWRKTDFVVRELLTYAKKYNKIVFAIGTPSKNDGKVSIYNVMGGSKTRHDPDGILFTEPVEGGINVTSLKNRSGKQGAVFFHEFDAGTKTWGKVEEVQNDK